MRQGANSAVRFTTYATLKQLVQGTARPGQPLPSAITFGIGGIAGLVTVYTTMPLEYESSLLHTMSKLTAHQRYQDEDAIPRCEGSIPQFLPLRLPHIH